jgi:hypothetical protein
MPEKRQTTSAHAAASGNRSAAKAAKQKIDARQKCQLAINYASIRDRADMWHEATILWIEGLTPRMDARCFPTVFQGKNPWLR